MLTAENQLLYLACSPLKNNVTQERLVSLAFEIKDWDAFLKKAAYHRLPLRLYSFLKRSRAASFLEPQIWEKIQLASLRAQAQVMAHEAELKNLLPLFHQEKIELLLLKGAALLQTVYQKNPVRALADLDLLIHRKDLDPALALLKTMGYQRKLDHLPSQWHERVIFSQLDQAYFPLYHPERRVHLDLHTEAFEAPCDFNLKRDWLWENAQGVQMDEHKTLLPNPTCLFLHSLFHLAKHRKSRENLLGWYLDLDECLGYFQSAIEGEHCRKIIQNCPEKILVLEVLNFIRHHFSSRLPSELESLIEEAKPGLISLDDILSPVKEPHADRYSLFSFYWGLIRGVRKKIWYLVRWCLPDRSYLAAKYRFGNGIEKIAAYLKHLITMALKGVSLGIYLLRKNQHTGGKK